MKYYPCVWIIIILLLATGPVLAIDIRGNVYNELAVQNLHLQSLLNPGNIQSRSEFQFCTKGNLIVKTDFRRSSGTLRVKAFCIFPAIWRIWSWKLGVSSSCPAPIV